MSQRGYLVLLETSHVDHLKPVHEFVSFEPVKTIAKFKIGSEGVSPAPWFADVSFACFYYFTPKTRIFAYFALHAGGTPALQETLQGF